MTARSTDSRELLWGRTLALVAVFLAVAAALAFGLPNDDRTALARPTIAEKLILLRAERAELQARADSLTRLELLQSFRAASLLFDALAARYEPERERPFDLLPEARREVFARLDAVNAALRSAIDRPGAAGRAETVAQAASGIPADLERMASVDLSPVILSYTPMFLAPRKPTGEPALVPGPPATPPPESASRDPEEGKGGAGASRDGDDPAIEIEILGLRLTAGQTAPVLTIGSWRGEATVTPERLRFVVPRSALPSDATHVRFAAGSLFLRHASRTLVFQVLFASIPEKPGAFALDQKVQSAVPESNTLVSPEILARAPAGQARTVRRCFDPPAGWRFDKSKRRIVIVERLGWLDDIPDETMNSGSVEFVREDRPSQICIAVVAKAATKEASSATIGRFEATLVRDVAVDRVVRSGIRSLGWNEPVPVPFEPGMAEWKLYVRLFDEIDREFEGKAGGAEVPSGLSFLRIAIDGEVSLTLEADTTGFR